MRPAGADASAWACVCPLLAGGLAALAALPRTDAAVERQPVRLSPMRAGSPMCRDELLGGADLVLDGGELPGVASTVSTCATTSEAGLERAPQGGCADASSGARLSAHAPVTTVARSC